MSEWISVKERLPELHTSVLVYRKNLSGMGGYVNIDHMDVMWADDEPMWSGDVLTWKSRVTHWMPLPEPPVDIAELATTTATVSETERVRCADCKHLMFSDCYGECGAGHRGIVRPDDTCPYGERRDDGGI